MENIRKSIALKLRARNSLLLDKTFFSDLYPSKQEVINLIENDITALQDELTKKTPEDEKYENFITILKKIRTVSTIVNTIQNTSVKRIPIYTDIHSYDHGEFKYCQKKGLIFSLKERFRQELFLNLSSETIDFESLPYFRTAEAYLSLSCQYFKTSKAIVMSLKPRIRPSISEIKRPLYYTHKFDDVEVHTVKLKGLHKKNLYRLTKTGEARRKNILSFAKIFGLLELDLVNIDTFPDDFRGYRVLDWNYTRGFHFNDKLTEELIRKHVDKSKILPEKKVNSNKDRVSWFYSTANKLGISTDTPLILTEKGETLLKKHGKYFIKDKRVFSRQISASDMRMYITILYLIQTYGFLSASECYNSLYTPYCRGKPNGIPGAIYKMLERNLIKYAGLNGYFKTLIQKSQYQSSLSLHPPLLQPQNHYSSP